MARSKVELFGQIRTAHEGDGLSIRALAERCGTHRRMVRQALENALRPPRKTLLPRDPVADTKSMQRHPLPELPIG